MIIDFEVSALEEQIKQAVIEDLGDDFATVSGTVASAAYISSSTTIDFYNGDGQVISQIDASKFVTDGMVDNVYISGNTLYIVFNTDAGKQTIEVEIPSVFNPDNYYTKAETDAAITAATQNLATEAYVDAAVTAATEDMATEAYVDAAITAATEDLATESYVDNAITAATEDLASESYVDSSITAATQSLEITGMDIHNSATIAPTYVVLSGTTTYADGNTKNFTNMGALDAVRFAKSGPMSSYDYVTLEALRKKIDATKQVQRTSTTAPYELLDANGNVIGNFNTCSSSESSLKTIPNLYGFQLSSSYVPSGSSVTFCIHDTNLGYYMGGVNINMGKRTSSQVIEEGTLTRVSGSYNAFTLREDDTRILYLWLELSEWNNPTLYVGWQPRPNFGYADASALVTTADTQNFLTSGDIKTVQSKSLIGTGNQDLFVSLTQAEYDALVQAGTVDTAITYYITDAPAPVTSGDVQAQITAATQNFVTSGQVQSQITAATQNFVTSADVEAQITSKGYATEAYVTGATSGLQETLVSGTNIKTVGGNSLLGSGNIPWPAVDTVLATGSTNAIENGTVAKALELKANKSDIPTKVSDLENDEGYLTSADTQGFTTSGDVKSQIEAYHYITSGDAKSQIEGYNYAPLEVSTPYSAVSTSAEYFFGLTPLDKSDYIDGTAMSIAQDGKIFYHQTVTTGYLPCIYYTDDEVAGFMGLVTGGSTPLVYGEPYELELVGGAVGLDDAYNNELLPSDFWAVIDGSSITFYNAVPGAVKTVVYSDQLQDWATEAYVDNAITAATQNFVTSGDVQSQITTNTTDCVRRYDTIGPYMIRTLSQAEYDQISEPDETTLYIIKN